MKQKLEDSLVGEKKRIKEKKKKENLVKDIIKTQMELIIPCLNLVEYKKTQFFNQQDRFLKDIQESYSSQYFAFAYNLMIDKFNHNVKYNNWDAEKLSKLSPERIESHFRSDTWFFKFNELSEWELIWKNHLSKNKNIKHTKEDILASIAISAICYGGLNIPHTVLALVNTLTNNSKPLTYGDYYWIDLHIYESGFDKNHEIDEKKVHIKRWYPDNYSLMWINNFLVSHCHDKTTFDLESLFKLIFSYMIKIVNLYDSKFKFESVKNFKDICDSGIGIAESSPGVHLNQTLVGYAKGEIKSSSLAPEYLKNALLNRYQVLKTSYQTEAKARKDRVPKPFLIRLSSILTAKNKSLKTNKEEIIKLIPNMEFKELSEYILLSWLLYHLKMKDHAISTMSNYLSLIGYDWLEIPNETFSDYEELENYYEEILSDVSNGYYGRLKDIHEYAVKIKAATEVSIFKDKFKSDTVVSTGFLTDKFLFEFINNLVTSKDRYVKKDMYLALFIIAFRTGFRISELLKIRIRDIEIRQHDIWLYIRVNQYGNHKSKSAKRKFPLGLFLTQSEDKFIRKFITIKEMKPNVVKSTPLFGFDFNPSYALTNTSVNRITRSFITEKYKTKITFHTFRHTALSRLHIILSDNKYLIEKFTNYDEKQIKRIQTEFNYKGKNVFWNLAALAGHNTPSTTFASYLHFTDFILFTALKNNSNTINYQHFSNASGCSHQYLASRILQKPSIYNSAIPINKAGNIIKKSLNSYTNKIKPASKADYALGLILNRNSENYIQPQDCYQILKTLEAGGSTEKLAHQLKIRNETIQGWLKAAKEISEMKSQLNVPRHFKRSKKESRIYLAPNRPQSLREIEECEEIADKYLLVWKKHPKLFENSLRYFLFNTVSSRPGQTFGNKENINEYLTILSEFFGKSRIRVSVNLTESKKKSHTITQQENIWKAAIGDRATYARGKNYKSTLYPYGKATVSIKHLKEKSIKKNRKTKNGKYKYYHTNSIKFSFHLLAILHLEELNLKKYPLNS